MTGSLVQLGSHGVEMEARWHTEQRKRAARNVKRDPDAAEILHARSASIQAVVGGTVSRFTQCLTVLREIADQIQAPMALVDGLAAIHDGARVTTVVERLRPLPPRYLCELERLLREAEAEKAKDEW